MSDPAPGTAAIAKMFLNDNVKVDGQVEGRALDVDYPMMGLIENIQLPMTVRVELNSEESGHLMVSPIELNIGNYNHYN